jgi:hypothetical protein
MLRLFGFFNPIEVIKRSIFSIFGIDDALLGGIIAGGGSLLGGLFGGDDEPEYSYQTPDWVNDAYRQAWAEISAPATYGSIPQSYVDAGIGDIEKMYADYMQGGTYNYNTNNMMDSGIYENYLQDTADKQATALGEYMSNIEYQNALMKNQAEQNRLSNMANYVNSLGGMFGSDYTNALNQYQASLANQQANSQSSSMLGGGLGSLGGYMMGLSNSNKINNPSNYGNQGNTFNQYTSALGDYTSNKYNNLLGLS